MEMKAFLEILKVIVSYFIPISAFILSVVAFVKSRKVSKIEEKLKEYDLQIKKHEVEKIESEKSKTKEACVKARIVNVYGRKYKIKIYNSGSAPAYNVDYDIPEEYQIQLTKEITPFEKLEPEAGFEEPIGIYIVSENKYKVITKWQDEDGKEYTNVEIQTWQ